MGLGAGSVAPAAGPGAGGGSDLTGIDGAESLAGFAIATLGEDGGPVSTTGGIVAFGDEGVGSLADSVVGVGADEAEGAAGSTATAATEAVATGLTVGSTVISGAGGVGGGTISAFLFGVGGAAWGLLMDCGFFGWCDTAVFFASRPRDTKIRMVIRAIPAPMIKFFC